MQNNVCVTEKESYNKESERWKNRKEESEKGMTSKVTKTMKTEEKLLKVV